MKSSVNSFHIFSDPEHKTQPLDTGVLFESVEVCNLICFKFFLEEILSVLTFEHEAHVDQKDQGDDAHENVAHQKSCCRIQDKTSKSHHSIT